MEVNGYTIGPETVPSGLWTARWLLFGAVVMAVRMAVVRYWKWFRLKRGPQEVADGADLQGADLQGADLQGANLQVADLKGANLSGANLERADLFLADFVEAKLVEAKLVGAKLHGANLQGADLERADLAGASASWDTGEVRTVKGTKWFVEGTKWPEGFDPVAAGVIFE
ncbi:MAG: pentapeptide repeat-containing protein [Acidimicrobiales bacterium]